MEKLMPPKWISYVFLSLTALMLISCSSKSYDKKARTSASEESKPQTSRRLRETEKNVLSDKSKSVMTGGLTLQKGPLADMMTVGEVSTKQVKNTQFENKAKPVKPVYRMVIYKGIFDIYVDSVKDSVKRIEDLVKGMNGYIDDLESYNQFQNAKIILRVPVKSFEQAIEAVTKLGKVTRKNISARDVTGEFRDTYLRMLTAKKVLARLQQLLSSSRRIEERVSIIREIERVSNQIQKMETQLQYLKNQAAFSTIILNLSSSVKKQISRYIASPFGWIRTLGADNSSNNYDKTVSVEFKKPKGFFLLDEDYKDNNSEFALINPGKTAQLRYFTVENYPKADQKFWVSALKKDSANRKYIEHEAIPSQGKMNSMTYKISHGRIYFLAVHVKEKDILLIEGVFNTEKIFNENKTAVIKFIESIRW